MRVKCLNSSSVKTRNLIKKTFAELIHEKRQLSKVTVKELVEKAGITRSTFYTHYENIYEVAKDYQLQTIDLLCNEALVLTSKEDIENYFENIINCLKENEETYKLLFSTDDTLLFLHKLKNIAGDKIYKALKNVCDNKYLELDVSFFMAGITMEFIKYFRNESNYSLAELLINIKKWFKKIF